MRLFRRKPSINVQDAAASLLVLIWTWSHEPIFGDDLSGADPSFRRELFRLQFFAIDLAAYKALESKGTAYPEFAEALDSFHSAFFTESLAPTSESRPTAKWRSLLHDLGRRDPEAISRFEATKTFAPAAPRGGVNFRMFAEVLHAGDPVDGLARVIRGSCRMPENPFLPLHVTATFKTTHDTVLQTFDAVKVQ